MNKTIIILYNTTLLISFFKSLAELLGYEEKADSTEGAVCLPLAYDRNYFEFSFCVIMVFWSAVGSQSKWISAIRLS